MPDTHSSTFVLGRTDSQPKQSRTPWYVTATVTTGYATGQWRTVNHDPVSDPAYVKVSFTVGPRVFGADWDQAVNIAGQVSPEDRRIIGRPGPGKIKPDERDGYDVRHIIDLLAREWSGHYLNAGCVHQGMPTSRGPAGDPAPCPVTGYKYGHAWLVRPLDQAARDRIESLQLAALPARRA
jgi:hypothetical protein